MDTAQPLASLKNKTVSEGALNAHAALLAAPKGYLSLDVEHDPDVPEKNGKLTVTARVTSPQPIVGASVIATLGGKSYNLLIMDLVLMNKPMMEFIPRVSLPPTFYPLILPFWQKQVDTRMQIRLYQPEP